METKRNMPVFYVVLLYVASASAFMNFTPRPTARMDNTYQLKNFAHPATAPRVSFDVVHMEICKDDTHLICAEVSWSVYETSGHRLPISTERNRRMTIGKWYLLKIECESGLYQYEMDKATTLNIVAKLIPQKNYTVSIFSMFQDQATALKNYTFDTGMGAPSAVQQVQIEVLERPIPNLPAARKIQVSWYPPLEIGANFISGYLVGLYRKPEFSFKMTSFRNTTIKEVDTNQTWCILEPVGYYEERLFVRVTPYNLLQNGSLIYGRETVADIFLRSQYARELTINSVGSQSVDIEIDREIFKDVIDAKLVTNISVYVSPLEDRHWLSWKDSDYSRAIQEDRLKRKYVRSVYKVSPFGWTIQNSMDKSNINYLKFPCFQGGDRRKVVCSVGVDEKCYKHIYTQICNGPLIAGANYTVFIRATLKKSNFLPEYDDSKPLVINLKHSSRR